MQRGVPHGRRALHELLDVEGAEALEGEVLRQLVVGQGEEPQVVGDVQVDAPCVVVLSLSVSGPADWRGHLHVHAREVQRGPQEGGYEGAEQGADGGHVEPHPPAAYGHERPVHVVGHEAAEALLVKGPAPGGRVCDGHEHGLVAHPLVVLDPA